MSSQGELIPVSGREVIPWSEMVKSFLDTRNTDSTRRTYKPTVEELAELWPAGPATVIPAELATWKRGLLDRMEAGELAPGTVKRKLMAARSFFKFAYLLGQCNIGKDLRAYILEAPQADVQKPFLVLSEAEETALLDALSGQQRQVVAVMLYAGLRVSEVCKLRADHYWQDEEGRFWLKVALSKGGRGREVPVGDTLADILGKPAGDGLLFPSRQRSGDGSLRYSRARLFQIVRGATKRAGIGKRISPHSLRHTAAMRWLKQGVPLLVIQTWLGHSSLNTTRRYLDHNENGEAHKYMK